MNLCKVSVSPSNSSKALPASLSLAVAPHGALLERTCSLPHLPLSAASRHPSDVPDGFQQSFLWPRRGGGGGRVWGTRSWEAPLSRPPQARPPCGAGRSAELSMAVGFQGTPPPRSRSQTWRRVSHTVLHCVM